MYLIEELTVVSRRGKKGSMHPIMMTNCWLFSRIEEETERVAIERKGISQFSGVWAGSLGGLAFITTFLWGGSFIVALGAAFGVFLTSWLLLAPKKKEEHGVSSLSTELQREILSRGRENVEELAGWIRRIQEPSVRIHGERILTLAHKILQEVEKDPKDIPLAKSFLIHHLQAVAIIIRQYVELSEKTLQGNSFRDTMQRVEDSLHQIAKAFEGQYERLLAKDVLDLDVELKVLEQTIQMETELKKGGTHE